MTTRRSPRLKHEPSARRGILVEVVGPPGSGKTRTVQGICAGMPRNLRIHAISNDTCRGSRLLLGGLSELTPLVPLGHPARRTLFGAALILLDEAADLLLREHDVVIAEHHVGFYLAMEHACGRATDLEWVCRDIREPDLTLLLNHASTAGDPLLSAATHRLHERAGRELNQLAGSKWVRVPADHDVADECVRRILAALQSGVSLG